MGCGTKTVMNVGQMFTAALLALSPFFGKKNMFKLSEVHREKTPNKPEVIIYIETDLLKHDIIAMKLLALNPKPPIYRP